MPRKSIARPSKFRSGSPPPMAAARAAKSLLPPIDPLAGGPDRPILVRTVKLKAQRSPNKLLTKPIRKDGSPSLSASWLPLSIAIPREIAEVTGLEMGMTMCIEGYRDGRIRIFPAGDLVSREEQLV